MSKRALWNRWRFAAVVVATSLAAGCATQYQQTGFSGGVEDTPVNSNTYRILARGNAFTSQERTRDFVLLRASELAIAGGFSHFVILDSQAYAKQSTITMPGTYQSSTHGQASVYGNTAYGSAQTYGTYTPPTATTISKPRNEVIVRLLRSDEAGSGVAYDARMVHGSLAPRLKGVAVTPPSDVRPQASGPRKSGAACERNSDCGDAYR
jgi:hypothetical protein